MKKGFKLVFNLAMFLIVTGFVWYMAKSIGGGDAPEFGRAAQQDEPFESRYFNAKSFEMPEDVNRFDLHDTKLFVSAGQSIYILDADGNQLSSFSTQPHLRDITVSGDEIFLLYPAQIAVHHYDSGELLRQWEACSQLSDYCSFTVAGEAIYVTDAENKNICKYTTEGYFVKFIHSPKGFIIPSYSFDIDVWNDTIYCSNSGRHLIETYTLNGDFIASFGSSGAAAGSFAGCCNPVYIAFTPSGTLITSEKGIPRISNFQRNGKFNEIWLNNRMLGSRNNACAVRASEDRLFVAVRNRILIYQQY